MPQMETKLNEISRENLQKIILEMAGFLTEEQYQRLQGMVEAIAEEDIDEGEVYLDTVEYEDYSGGYWNRDWITEYYDNQDRILDTRFRLSYGLPRTVWMTGGMRKRIFFKIIWSYLKILWGIINFVL